MRFQHPEFLWALLTLIIPVLIHLFNFRIVRKVRFSNVRFLKSVEQTSSSARKLKRLLLLAFRVLALSFIVLAFACPYIPSGDTTVENGQHVVEIYVDNSFSMEMPGAEGALLDEAKRKAREVASLYGFKARFRLLTNDLGGRHLRLMDYDDFLAAIDEIKVSAVYRTLHEVIAAHPVQETGSARKKTLVFISDFQKNVLNEKPLKLDSLYNVHCIYLEPGLQPNVSVDSVWFSSPVHKPGEREELVVEVRNHSDKKALHVPVVLTVDGQQKGIGDLSVDRRSSVRDTFSFSGLSAGWKKGSVRIRDYPMNFDDRYLFAFEVRNVVPIMVVNNSGQNRYLSAVYAAEPFFRPEQAESGQINYGELRNFPFLVLNEVTGISEGLAQQMARYVEAGGHLMVFPSLEDLSGLKTLSRQLGTDEPLEVVERKMAVARVHFEHPLFQGVFEQRPHNADLPVATRFVRYKTSSRSGRERLLDFADGGSFISRYSLGRGKVYLSAVPLSEESGNFVRHSFFVPVMYRSALLSVTDVEPALLIGRDTYIDVGRVFHSSGKSLMLKKDDLEIVPDLRQTESSTQLFFADQIVEPGHYDIFNGDSLIAVAAFNSNRLESDLSYIPVKELQDAFSGLKPKILRAEADTPVDSIKGINNGVQLWKLCLILALVFLVAEVVLLNLYTRQDIKVNK